MFKAKVAKFKLPHKYEERIKLWKRIYYMFHDIIEKERIFSKIPTLFIIRTYYTKAYASVVERIKNFLEDLTLIPMILIWKLFFVKFEYLFYKFKYGLDTLDNLNGDFNFLFVLNTKDHVMSAIPVIEHLERHKRVLIVTFKDVYVKYLDDFKNLKNSKVVFFDHELKNLPIIEYIRSYKESSELFNFLVSKVDYETKEILLVDRYFIRSLLKKELIQYYFFDKIFNTYNIDGVISIVFTTAFEIAKEKGIPTFILQHGAGGGGHYPYISDYIITYDDITKEDLERWTDNTVKILSLGSPRFEYLWKISSLKRNFNKFNKKLGRKESSRRNVVYISVAEEWYENEKLFLALKELAKVLPDDCNLIIKLHPRENKKRFSVENKIKHVFSKNELKKTIIIRDEFDFYELLANSYIVISTVSTGLFEAIAMDVPVIQINFTGQRYPEQLDLSTFGGKRPITESNVLVNEVLTMLKDKTEYNKMLKMQDELKNRIFKNFGRCGEVIAETIIKICNGQSGGYDGKTKYVSNNTCSWGLKETT